MDNRTHIPALALLGLSFTGCPGEDAPNPIVGEWSAIQFDGMKLPEQISYGEAHGLQGLALTVEDDLAGELALYYDVDYGDYARHDSYGSDLLVDDSAAPKYRIELARDFLGDDDYDDYYTSVGTAVTSDDDTEPYIGDGASELRPVESLTAPIRRTLAPADLIINCTLDQDVLSCETEAETPIKMVFQRKPKEAE